VTMYINIVLVSRDSCQIHNNCRNIVIQNVKLLESLKFAVLETQWLV